MKTLLRSVLVIDPTDNQDMILENHKHLDSSNLTFSDAEDTAIWTFVSDFIQQHHHPPTMSTVESHFARTGETTTVDRLHMLKGVRIKTRGDFLQHLEIKAEDRRKMMVGHILQEAAEIVTKGLQKPGAKKGEKIFLQGPQDAMRYLMDEAHAIVTPTSGARLSGDVVHDGEDFIQHYDRVKNDPLAGVGQFVGIKQMDDSLGGAKKFELWTHAAFTGGLKSTIMLNWAYNQAIYYGHSSLIFSLEMPYVQVRNLLYAMHSSHEKFEGVHAPLEYQRLKEGRLSVSEERFLKDYVVPDFNNTDHHGSIHVEVADPNKSDFTVMDMRMKAETLYNKNPFKLLFVDHALLLAPKRWVPSTTDRLNEVIRDCKKMAMSFNKGAGMAVVLLFQISREGYKAARKARGLDRVPSERESKSGKTHTPSDYVYDLDHLSYSNECLTSSTFVKSDRGILPITEIKVGDKAWSSTGWKSVSHVFDQGERGVWRVESDRGMQLEGTGNHRLRVMKNCGYEWCEIQNLSPGDWLVSTRGDYPWPSSAPVLPEPWGDVTHLTNELAYLLGAWDGDGNVRQRTIGFTGNRKEVHVRDAIVSGLLKTFSIQPYVYEFRSRSGSFDIEMPGDKGKLKAWFESLAGARGVVVPEIIYKAPREMVSQYLKGLFDTDGWINPANIVGIKMKSRPFLSDIQLLLSALGYETMLVYTPSTILSVPYDGWTLRLLGYESRTQFYREIGFTEPHKQEALNAYVMNPPKRKATDQKYPVADIFISLSADLFPGRKIKRDMIRRSHFNAVLKAKKTKFVARGAIQYLIERADEMGVLDDRVEFLRDLLRLQLTQVSTVTNTGRIEPVYDIEVGGDHEYQTGGFLSHNCERSSDVVTATWIDHKLSADGEILIQCLKARDVQPFKPFKASIFWPCRRFRTLEDPTLEDLNQASVELDVENL